MDEKQVRAWIEGSLAPSPMRQEAINGGDVLVVYSWGKGRAFLRNDRLQLLDVEHANPVTLGEVVDDLGIPATVAAVRTEELGGTHYRISLNYPDQGLRIETSGPVLGDAAAGVRLTRDMRSTAVRCFAPGSSESLVQRGFFGSEGLAWPGFETAVPLGEP
jgi:hypothetical protein